MTHANCTDERTLSSVEEGFVVDVQSFLQELLEARHMSRADLARAMGVSRGRVTQIFSDECTNLTVRLLARAVFALGEEPEIDCQTTRNIRAKRNRMRQAKIVESSANVVTLWKDETVPLDSSSTQCSSYDNKLFAVMANARHAGVAR